MERDRLSTEIRVLMLAIFAVIRIGDLAPRNFGLDSEQLTSFVTGSGQTKLSQQRLVDVID
jgi:hypothetical protein